MFKKIEAFSSTTAAKRQPVRLSVTQEALCSRACVSPGIYLNNKYFIWPQTEVKNCELNPVRSINRCVKTHWAGSFGFAWTQTRTRWTVKLKWWFYIPVVLVGTISFYFVPSLFSLNICQENYAKTTNVTVRGRITGVIKQKQEATQFISQLVLCLHSNESQPVASRSSNNWATRATKVPQWSGRNSLVGRNVEQIQRVKGHLPLTSWGEKNVWMSYNKMKRKSHLQKKHCGKSTLGLFSTCWLAEVKHSVLLWGNTDGSSQWTTAST